ncbi:hypothetical protein NF701_06355 [Sphingomonadaceae bacterium OTU29THOMA1]|nr:hypothetical protein NF701_06355 [Sphingomonadaceae bacterium OTU29THOMA1]
MFEAARSKLQCQGADFDVPKGNIFKYAINARAYGFVNQAIDEWAVDLNWIDSDGTTLLDYVARQIDRAAGTTFERELRIYYERIAKHGGRLRTDLH